MALPSPLVDAQLEGQARLRRLTESAVARIWGDLPGYDRVNLDQWLSRVLPVIATSQRASVALTEAYLARSLGRQPIGIDPADAIGAAVRNGIDPATVYERPFITVWTALGAGTMYEDAVASGLARAKSSAAMDVQMSMRGAADAIEEADEGIFGYQRVANAGACDFCLQVDGAYVKASDGFVMALHNSCGCGLEPLTEPHRNAVYLPDGTRIRETKWSKTVIHQHGELGPILGSPDHNFTTV